MALADSTNPMQGVSGPGKFAKRTDLQYQPDAYGEGVAMTAQMQGAPLAKAPATPAATGTQVKQAAASAPITELYAPTTRPNEPVTHGVGIGPGAGPEALAMNNSIDTEADKARMLSYLPALEAAANQPNSSQAFRNYVRVLRANLL